MLNRYNKWYLDDGLHEPGQGHLLLHPLPARDHHVAVEAVELGEEAGQQAVEGRVEGHRVLGHVVVQHCEDLGRAQEGEVLAHLLHLGPAAVLVDDTAEGGADDVFEHGEVGRGPVNHETQHVAEVAL